jgi:predicted nucleotidyltransferase
MRINRETLIRIAKDTVAQRVRQERSILCAYLCGSLLEDEYLIGGTGDIDLVFVHIQAPETPREIVRLTDDVHLDIAHHAQKEYLHVREVRNHPWMGPTLFSCKPFYDPQHFLDFTQASVRGQFNRPEIVIGRVRQQAEHARQIWQDFSILQSDPGPQEIVRYLRSVEHAANAVALLTGSPLTERRFLLQFPDRAQQLGQPGLYGGLLTLVGAPFSNAETWRSWLEEWRRVFTNPCFNPRLHPARQDYYLKACDALLQGAVPQAALWPLLRTWSLAEAGSQNQGTAGGEAWRSAMEQLHLVGPAFRSQVDALDVFLDLVEETIETWAETNSLSL